MSFGIYAIGFAILIGGLMCGAHLMHMPGTLDCGLRHRSTRCRDSVGSKSNTPEGIASE